MRAGKVAGMQLILNNWFLLLIVLFSLVGMGGKILAVFSAVLWHELGHAVTAIGLGFRVRELELLPFGGVARIERLGEASMINELMMAAAGPLASLVLAVFVYIVMEKLSGWDEGLYFYYKTNLVLAGFNLLPALPLDGGRMLRACLALRNDYNKATQQAAKLSQVTSLLLLVAVGAGYWFDDTVNLTFIVAAGFLYAAAKVELNTAAFRTMRILARKKSELSRRGVMATAHFTALADTAAGEIVRLFEPDKYHIVLIVDNDFSIVGTLTETQVWEALPEKGMKAKIADLLE